MAITAKDVQALREKTGCGMMDCKKALTETNGDMEEAIKFLREKGLAKAEKKASRIAAEGLIDIYTEGNATGIIEVNSETDFVAKNETFRAFVHSILITVVKNNPADVEALLEMKLDGSDMTVKDALVEKIATIGENMSIRRFVRVEGKTASYIHGEGKIGTIVMIDTDIDNDAAIDELGKNICMQITALNPEYLAKEDVPQSVLDNEKEILIAQIKQDPKMANKPEAIIEKMVSGRLSKFYDLNCLLEQEYVKDGSLKVCQYVENTAKELGGKIAITKFLRLEKGEGLQKKEDDFAAEVAKMAQ